LRVGSTHTADHQQRREISLSYSRVSWNHTIFCKKTLFKFDFSIANFPLNENKIYLPDSALGEAVSYLFA